MTKKILLAFSLFIVAGCNPSGGLVNPATDDTGSTSPVGAPAYVDEVDLMVMESYPVQVAVAVRGNLPTPCHALRYQYEIQDFGAENRVEITVSSEADSEASCTQVLKPFEARIPLDLSNAAEGVYVVYVNGELVGEFNYPG